MATVSERRSDGGRVLRIRLPLLAQVYLVAFTLGITALILVPQFRGLWRGDVGGFLLSFLGTSLFWGTAWCFTLGVVRTQLVATEQGLTICNGFRTIEIAWPHVLLYAGVPSLLVNAEVVRLEPIGQVDGSLVTIGRLRTMTSEERRGRWLGNLKGQWQVFELDPDCVAGRLRDDDPSKIVIPRAGVWGANTMWRGYHGGLLIVRDDGEAVLANGVRGGWFFGKRVRKRFQSVLRELARFASTPAVNDRSTPGPPRGTSTQRSHHDDPPTR